MTGAEHYAEAEYLLARAGDSSIREAAQVHATLALAAATALGAHAETAPGSVYSEWFAAAGPAKAKQVAS